MGHHEHDKRDNANEHPRAKRNNGILERGDGGPSEAKESKDRSDERAYSWSFKDPGDDCRDMKRRGAPRGRGGGNEPQPWDEPEHDRYSPKHAGNGDLSS